MLLKRNLLETVTLISSSGTLICILLNYVTNISPITGVWFHLYTFLLFIVSVTFSFKTIQWLLHLNKPLKYDIEDLVKRYPILKCVSLDSLVPPKRVLQECKEYDTNDLSVISTVLERKLVSSWYTHYVSQEIGFPFACKQLLDQMIGKTFQICNNIETKDVFVDICSVLITHLKEYRKAVKRHEKSPGSSVESHYKKSHQIFAGDKKMQSAEHCTNLLRVILKDLVPWELWDTPHSELLVRVLAKKLDNFIDTTLSDPVWLNDKLMTALKGKESATENSQTADTGASIPVDEHDRLIDEKSLIFDNIKPEQSEEIAASDDGNAGVPTIESALSTLVANTTAPILQKALNKFEAPIMEEQDESGSREVTMGSEPVDISASPVLRQRRGRQGRSEVKIYDRIIEGSVKTWETDTDLQCISLGQDLLASLDGEITLSRLWGQEDAEVGKEGRLWFGEEDGLDMELDTSPSLEPSPVRKEPQPQHSPKPAEVLLKDLQTTVHQAKTRIGDLQVPKTVLDVPNNDEAAGMMEGLLDFGISNLKRGLRFTGLSDDSQDKSPSHREKERPAEKSPPPESKHKPYELPKLSETPYPDPKETGSTSLLQKEDNGTTAPPLVKQQRVSSQDCLPPASAPRPIPRGDTATGPPPAPPPPAAVCDSPEPEYEEAADLSTSIAKLRCLLQQRAEAQQTLGRAEAPAPWREAPPPPPPAECRGRAGRGGARPVDTATAADEYDTSAERNPSPNQASNNMQRLDKLFQRTVTGVFNSIKTAVGAEAEGGGAAVPPAAAAAPAAHQWTYVCTSVELSTGGAVARLVGSRRAHSHVDAALDSLDQLSAPAPRLASAPEDLDEWLAGAGRGAGACAELCAAAGLARAHVTQRAAAALAIELAESFIDAYLDAASRWLRAEVFAAFAALQGEREGDSCAARGRLRPLRLRDTCAAILDTVPALQVFGSEAAEQSVHLVVSSFSHKQVNKDVLFRVLDLLTVHFKTAAGRRAEEPFV